MVGVFWLGFCAGMVGLTLASVLVMCARDAWDAAIKAGVQREIRERDRRESEKRMADLARRELEAHIGLGQAMEETRRRIERHGVG